MKMKKSLLLVPIIFGLLILVVSSINEINRSEDADADGVYDDVDNCIGLTNPSQEDFDLDNMGNDCDPDDDNDAIMDYLDAFDEDPLEWADFDFDNIGSVADTDDDNDGTLDHDDPTPVLSSEKITQNYLKEIQDCSDAQTGSSRLLCYSNLFDLIVKQEENNIDTLETALSLTKLGAIDDCHFLSHSIGHSAFAEVPDVYQNLRGVDGSLCRGGFYHGIMAAYFHNLNESNRELSAYKTVCNELIGTPNYTKCVHGIGHGLRHYFTNDLNAAINTCDQMSFYQGSICMGGLMMQYTDEKLTQSNTWQNDISKICSRTELRDFDYIQCNDNLGLSLAFHTNHDYNEASKYCNLIFDDVGKNSCLEGLKREINDAKLYKEYDPAKGLRELVQPMWIKHDSNKWIVDFRSVAVISNFDYDEVTKTMSFSFDTPHYIIIYISTDLLPQNPVVIINGKIQNNISIKHGLLFDHSMIRIEPSESGTAFIQNS
jgi:hypothetical protein